MKNFFLILTLLCCGCLPKVAAQWVVTVAGVLETPGANDGPALNARFNSPHGIATDSSGITYIADRYNHTIRKYNPQTGQVSTLAGMNGQAGSVDDIGPAARFNEPWGICVTPGGIAYVADTKNNKIRKVMPDGTVTTVAGSGSYGTSNGQALLSTFGNPTGIEMDKQGNIYVADHLTHIIRKISSNGMVSTLAGSPYITGDVDGTGLDAQFNRPYGLTLDQTGNILVADEWNHKIRRVTPNGEVTTLAGTGVAGLENGDAALSKFHYPWDLTVDGKGNIYVADGFNYVIRRIDNNGMVTSFAGMPQTAGWMDGVGGNAVFKGVSALAWCESLSAIYIADTYNHLIRVLYVDESPIATVDLVNVSGTLVFCEGEDAVFQASPDDYPSYSFYLDTTLVQMGSSPDFLIKDLQTGNYSVHVAAQTNDGETIHSDTTTIAVNPLPSPSIIEIGPLNFFEGDSVILIANGTGDFLWSNGSEEQAITVHESGTYFVEETLQGCVGISKVVIVEVTPLPDEVGITVEGNDIACPGEKVRLISSATLDNQWLRDGWDITGQTASSLDVTESGYYQVKVTDPVTGISVLSGGIEIVMVPVSDFNFSATPQQVMPGQIVTFSSTGSDFPIAFNWDFGDYNNPLANYSDSPSPSHIYHNEGDYDVTLYATDGYGCQDTIFKESFVVVNETPMEVVDDFHLPTAFTPNGDGENDLFHVLGQVTGDFTMRVFNHWGEQIFISENPAIGWDGTFNGLPAQSGTYVYLVETGKNAAVTQRSGYITLLR